MAPVLARLAATVVLLSASACANRLAARQAALAPLIGRGETDLVRALGVPSRTFESGGHRFLAFVDTRTAVIPGTYGPPPWGFWGPGSAWALGATPPQVIETVCETTFEIADATVVGFSLHGEGCG